jgi:hypothetical protein
MCRVKARRPNDRLRRVRAFGVPVGRRLLYRTPGGASRRRGLDRFQSALIDSLKGVKCANHTAPY